MAMVCVCIKYLGDNCWLTLSPQSLSPSFVWARTAGNNRCRLPTLQ